MKKKKIYIYIYSVIELLNNYFNFIIIILFSTAIQISINNNLTDIRHDTQILKYIDFFFYELADV